MLYPAFKLQDSIQQSTLGSKEWVKVSANLVKMREQRKKEFLARFGAPRGRRRAAQQVGCFGKLKRVFTCWYCRPAAQAADAAAARGGDDDGMAQPMTPEEALAEFDKRQREEAEVNKAREQSMKKTQEAVDTVDFDSECTDDDCVTLPFKLSTCSVQCASDWSGALCHGLWYHHDVLRSVQSDGTRW